jgi:adenosylcobinamide-GDP ribazoletransferase
MIGGFRVALQFLTTIPVPGPAPTEKEIATSYYFYPVVGLLLAAAAILLRFIASVLFPASFTIVVVLAFLIGITGGLHEDGLADVADGIAGGWTVEDRLRIMKDSRVGAYGALALIVAFVAKYVALSSMNPLHIDGALLASQVLGRWAFLPLGYFNRSAREGLGAQFIKGIGSNCLVITSLFSLAILTWVSGTTGVIGFVMATAVVTLASVYFRRKLGGITGDCFGATFQFVEIAIYATFLA